MNVKKQQVLTEISVGLFMVLVLAALFILTVALSREALFRRSEPLEIVFDSVVGLRPGDNIGARGVTVGKVNAIKLEKDGVHVYAMLDTPIFLREDYRAEIKASSVLGGRFVEIDEGTDAAGPLAPKTVLKGSSKPDLMDVATDTISEIRVALNDGILEDLKVTMHQIRAISEGLNNGKGTLGRLLADDQLYTDLEATVANFRTVMDKVGRGEGTLGKLIQDEQVYDDIASVTANLRHVTDSVAKGEGMIGKLLGPDDTAYTDLTEMLASFRKISETMAKGDGTIGKLVMDDELYEELRGVLREARAAIDDMRETSPITTFSSIFFGAF